MALPALGIDIAKDRYQVALRQAGRVRPAEFPNEPAAFDQLSRWLARHGVTQVHACLEATGRYGDELAVYLHQAGHVVSRLNPAAVRDYARSQLRRTKTDAVDAALLADFCATQQPRPWTPPAAEVRELQALVRHLDALLQMRTQELNRLSAKPPAEPVRTLLTEHLAFLDAQIAQLKQQIRDHIDQHPGLRAQRELLLSIPGIADTTAAKLLAEDLLAFEDARAVAAYAGLSPAQRKSGTSVRGKPRLCKLGNDQLRAGLYLPALAALRFNPIVIDLADRLRARGKAKMVIVGAAMHKLLCLAYGVLKSGRPFDPDYRRRLQVA